MKRQTEVVGIFPNEDAITRREPQNAETGPKALLGVRLGLHDRLDESNRGGADLGGFLIRAGVHSA